MKLLFIIALQSFLYSCVTINQIQHTSVKGDTLEIIAEKYGVDTSELIKTNSLEDDHKVSPGEMLALPGSAEDYENYLGPIEFFDYNKIEIDPAKYGTLNIVRAVRLNGHEVSYCITKDAFKNKNQVLIIDINFHELPRNKSLRSDTKTKSLKKVEDCFFKAIRKDITFSGVTKKGEKFKKIQVYFQYPDSKYKYRGRVQYTLYPEIYQDYVETYLDEL
jgi:LysM repeat protein